MSKTSTAATQAPTGKRAQRRRERTAKRHAAFVHGAIPAVVEAFSYVVEAEPEIAAKALRVGALALRGDVMGALRAADFGADVVSLIGGGLNFDDIFADENFADIFAEVLESTGNPSPTASPHPSATRATRKR